MRYFLQEIGSARQGRPSIFVPASEGRFESTDDSSRNTGLVIDPSDSSCTGHSTNLANPSGKSIDSSENSADRSKSSADHSDKSRLLLTLRPGVRFHFFCSHTPCGDASIFPKDRADDDDDDDEPSEKRSAADDDAIGPDAKRRKTDEEADDIHRTGAKCLTDEIKQDPRLPGTAYHVLGAVRTKPGRGDRTLSVSCSDKLLRWHSSGVQVRTDRTSRETRTKGIYSSCQ